MIRNFAFICMLVVLLLPQGSIFASGLGLSITPTMFEMSAVPLQHWDSSIKVINPNAQPLTVYAQVMNFAPQGENGHGKFIPVFEDYTEGKTLAEWITVPEGSITIEPEGTALVPVSVSIPEGASPGGHYAAVMIKTQPPKSDQAFYVGTSQVVTSLFLVRIAGDVVENGTVRTFTVADHFVDVPEATFEVRFENKGNVHLQPQGEIVITNMWGKERGVIPINHQTHFGNVLPDSIRKFEFTWKGEPSFTDIGRYTANLTLAYGTDARKFATRTTSFWVVPVKQVLTVLGVLLFIIWFVSWAIRAYVRKMLSIQGVDAYVPVSQRAHVLHEGDVLIQRKPSVKAPIEEGVRDLRSRLKHAKALVDTLRTLGRFVLQYKIFFGSIVLIIVVISVVWHFFSQVTQSQRDYEVTIKNPDAETTISSEEIIYERQHADDVPLSVEASTKQLFTLILTNSSDTPGAAAALQNALQKEGYTIATLTSDFGEPKPRTVIVYDPQVQEQALSLSKFLDGVLLSASPQEAEDTPKITVFIGNDYDF